jgi:hypothetical protein
MNQRTLARKIRQQRTWCTCLFAATCLFTALAYMEATAIPSLSKVRYATVKMGVKGENVTASEVVTVSNSIDPAPSTFYVSSTPEPSSLLLLAPGLLLLLRRRHG